MFVARYSANIQSDIQRGWSSWNFGQDGFIGTEQEFKSYMQQATDKDPIYISGFEMYANDVRKGKFGELYENYWVVKDTENAANGLSCYNLNASTIENAIAEGKTYDGSGDGSSFDPSCATLVWSETENGFGLHIFEVED